MYDGSIYACMHVCIYVCMYVCMHACMYVCMYVCMHVCMYACMHVCLNLSVCLSIHPSCVMYTHAHTHTHMYMNTQIVQHQPNQVRAHLIGQFYTVNSGGTVLGASRTFLALGLRLVVCICIDLCMYLSFWKDKAFCAG